MSLETMQYNNSITGNMDVLDKLYTPLPQFQLTRLNSLLDLQRKRTLEDYVDPSSWQSSLIDKAIFSTFMDCFEQGFEIQARAALIIHRVRTRLNKENIVI